MISGDDVGDIQFFQPHMGTEGNSMLGVTTLMGCITELVQFKYWCIGSLFCNRGVVCMEVHASKQ